MPMLEVLEFRKLYRHGGKVFDARGRELRHVSACDPETGEVVIVDLRPSIWDRMVTPLRRSARGWLRELVFRSSIPTRHGFWPAPLRIVPNPPPTALP